jgi:tetratricopeptide (TPR) repeat protein
LAASLEPGSSARCGHQREDHPLGGLPFQPPARCGLPDRRADLQAFPQPPQHPRPAQPPRVDHLHLGAGRRDRLLRVLQTSTGRPADAEDSLRQALALYRHAKDRNGEAHALYALGDLQVRADRLAEAGDSYHQALALYRRAENRLGEANTLKRMGEFSFQKREYDQAEAAFDAAMAIFEVIDDRYSTVSTLMSRGRHRAALGRVDSFADWHRALILAGTVDSSLFAQIAAWIIGDIRRILVAGASNFLLSALPQLLDVDDSAEPSVGQRRGAYATVLSALRVIYELAAIRTLGLPPAPGSSAALLQRARQLDAETASAFELAALARETLDLVSAPIGDQRLVGLISAWVQTPTWEESQAFLAEHQKELLSADAVAALDAFATASPRSETLRVHLNLVDAAQRIGVDSAYREQRDEWEARTSGAQQN